MSQIAYSDKAELSKEWIVSISTLQIGSHWEIFLINKKVFVIFLIFLIYFLSIAPFL